jgi:hypothetical protein
MAFVGEHRGRLIVELFKNGPAAGGGSGAAIPMRLADVLVVLARVRLRLAAPAPVEQDGDGLYACAGRRIGLTHDGGKRAHGLACIAPAQ